MKYLKTFEDLQNKPEVGDYVIINVSPSADNNVREYIDNTIGVIHTIQDDRVDMWNNVITGNIIVKYINVPNEIRSWFHYEGTRKKYGRKYFRSFDTQQIYAFSKSKEELELMLQTKNYNL